MRSKKIFLTDHGIYILANNFLYFSITDSQLVSTRLWDTKVSLKIYYLEIRPVERGNIAIPSKDNLS